MKYYLSLLILLSSLSFGQEHLTIDKECSILGESVSAELSYFEDETASMLPHQFLREKSRLKKVKMTQGLQNFDFTSSSFFIHFVIDNESGQDQTLILETARPITNRANLYCVGDRSTVYSGDGIPFEQKSVPTNFSALPLFVPAGKSREYVLHVTSDGESLTVPMVFYDQKEYVDMDSDRQLFMGVFLGIFLFVVIIYTAFFVLLNESLFVLYVFYALFSGVMQMSLDGYLHEFLFSSGGYLSQHCQLVLASLTVIIGMTYASLYLSVSGTLKRIGQVIMIVVGITMILSLIPGTLYEVTYLLINGFSFVGLVYMIVAAVIQRRKNKDKVSRLFLIGLSFVGIGGLLFILGNFGIVDAPQITLNSLKIGTMIEMVFLSIMMAGRYKELQQEREKAQQALLVELEEKNRRTTETNERLEAEVQQRTQKIEAQRAKLKEQNEDFLSSVIYAKRIQSSVLANEEKFKKLLPNSFMFHKPKDVVSGDFYWIDQSDNGQIAYVTADCTGHGVPGALMSIIGNHVLESICDTMPLSNPGMALDELNVGMRKALNAQYSAEQLYDGMDLTMCVLDLENYSLSFSGARNSVFIARNHELMEIRGDRKSIGFNPQEDPHKYLNQKIPLQKGDIIYTCSDGFADQFGGEKDKKFMIKRLRKLFVEASKKPIQEQEELFETTLTEWMKGGEQLDDILVIGVQV